jgi:hypothetical protein
MTRIDSTYPHIGLQDEAYEELMSQLPITRFNEELGVYAVDCAAISASLSTLDFVFGEVIINIPIRYLVFAVAEYPDCFISIQRNSGRCLNWATSTSRRLIVSK